MKRGKVISILRFFGTIDREIQMNNAEIEEMNDRYYITLGAVNMDGLPHGKGGVSKPVENMVAPIISIRRSARRRLSFRFWQSS